MKNLNLKKKIVSYLLLASVACGTLPMNLAKADSSGAAELSSSMTSNMTSPSEQDWKVINTGIAAVKLLTKVDLRDVPFLKDLFPARDPIDYERIARDVSRIVKEAFVEHEMFNQSAALGTVVRNMDLIARTSLNDEHIFQEQKSLNSIMSRIEEADMFDRAVGYYASAAQMFLNAQSLRVVLNPSDQTLKTYLQETLRNNRDKVTAKAIDLRTRAQAEFAKKEVECRPWTNPETKESGWAYVNENRDLWPFYGPNAQRRCETAYAGQLHAKVTDTVFLEKMIEGWNVMEAALLGGEAGAAAYQKLADLQTGYNLDLDLSQVKYKVVHFEFSPSLWKYSGTVCNAIENAAKDASHEGQFPAERIGDLMQAVGCGK